MPNALTHHVMVVDDELMLTDMVARVLEGNYHITAANSGSDAISIARKVQPDLILLDIMLPDASGYDICRSIKEYSGTRHIPVIFISSLDSAFDKTEAFEVGAVDYMTKPIEVTELKMRIKTHITISHLQRRMEEIINQRTEALEKSNSALHAMLKHRETEMNAIEETMLARMKKHIFPYLDKIEKSIRDGKCITFINIIRNNLMELIPSTDSSLSAQYLKLAPSEIKVADLIRQGEQTKQIAQKLNLSVKSVFYYRNNIRKKLGLLNSKTNLSTYLQSLQSQPK